MLSSAGLLPSAAISPCSDSLVRASQRRRGAVACEVALKVEGSQQQQQQQQVNAGSRIRVKGPLKVYHVPKAPEFELGGMEGEVKDVITSWKGKPLSANLPYRVQFFTNVNEKQVKFLAHLREGEFEVIE